MNDNYILLALMVAIGPVLWAVGRVVEAAGELIEAVGCGLGGWGEMED